MNSMKKIHLYDDALLEEQFSDFKDKILSPYFPWYFYPYVSYDDEDLSVSPGQFVHDTYKNTEQLTPYFQDPIKKTLLSNINWKQLYSVRFRLHLKLPEPFFSDFHTDLGAVMDEESCALWTTAIFYINTNNGYTEFEDGTIVNCVENRLVTFPANIKHRGVSQTDEQTKVVLNMNFLKEPTDNYVKYLNPSEEELNDWMDIVNFPESKNGS